MIMTAVALLREKPHPNADEIRERMNRNICRCGTHLRIMQAVERAAKAEGARP
jgi:nicotinate dehydrogenase subunit A